MSWTYTHIWHILSYIFQLFVCRGDSWGVVGAPGRGTLQAIHRQQRHKVRVAHHRNSPGPRSSEMLKSEKSRGNEGNMERHGTTIPNITSFMAAINDIKLSPIDPNGGLRHWLSRHDHDIHDISQSKPRRDFWGSRQPGRTWLEGTRLSPHFFQMLEPNLV